MLPSKPFSCPPTEPQRGDNPIDLAKRLTLISGSDAEEDHVRQLVAAYENQLRPMIEQFLSSLAALPTMSILFEDTVLAAQLENTLIDHFTSLLPPVLLDAITLDSHLEDRFTWLKSHDLKTPLATISNLCEEVLDEYAASLPESARRLLDVARFKVYEISDTIDALRDDGN